MDNEILTNIIIGLPNFVGFSIAIGILYKRLVSQDTLIKILIEKWERCEDDTEREKLMSSSKLNE